MNRLVFLLAIVALCACNSPKEPQQVSILGSWVQDIPGMDGVHGFTLDSAGVASSVNMATLVYSSWKVTDDSLYLTGQSIGTGVTIDFCDSWGITKLTADSLVLTSADSFTDVYTRQK